MLRINDKNRFPGLHAICKPDTTLFSNYYCILIGCDLQKLTLIMIQLQEWNRWSFSGCSYLVSCFAPGFLPLKLQENLWLRLAFSGDFVLSLFLIKGNRSRRRRRKEKNLTKNTLCSDFCLVHIMASPTGNTRYHRSCQIHLYIPQRY